jgi:SET domain-containing protein
MNVYFICICTFAIIGFILFNIISINDVKLYVTTLVKNNFISKTNILNWINHDKLNTYVTPNIIVKYSEKIKGRGVFANKDYKINDILEICPTIKLSKNFGGPLQKYVYKYDDVNTLVAFGYCSIYNHSDFPNANYRVLNENQLEIKIIKDIKKGEEIFISYGELYWKNNNKKI